MSQNVLGTALVPCSYDPVTGYFRDGCCNTANDDTGSHVICAKVTAAFLAFSARRGNDLYPALSTDFAGSGRAIAGASARSAGAKHSRPMQHPQSFSSRPTSAHSTSSRSPRYGLTRSTR